MSIYDCYIIHLSIQSILNALMQKGNNKKATNTLPLNLIRLEARIHKAAGWTSCGAMVLPSEYHSHIKDLVRLFI